MKKVLALTLAFLLCAVTLATVSCGPAGTGADTGDTDTGSAVNGGTDEPEVMLHDYVVGNNAAVWGDTVYYYDTGDRRIKYQNVKDVQDTGTPLYDGDDEFAEIGESAMLVDEYATVENDGYPVLILAPLIDSRILSFNTRTNEWTVILDGIEGTVKQLMMYRDTIFFTTMEVVGYGERGLDTGMHRVDRDGGGYEEWYSQTTEMNLGINYVYDDTVYFIDAWSGAIYTCDTRLKNVRTLTDEIGSVMCVTDKYIYCTLYKDSDYALCKCDADDMSQYEVLIESSDGFVHNGIYYYLVDGDMSILYSYDLETGEKKTIFDVSDKGDNYMKLTYAFSDSYIINIVFVYADWTADDFDINNYILENYLTCIDLSSGEEWVIPY